MHGITYLHVLMHYAWEGSRLQCCEGPSAHRFCVFFSLCEPVCGPVFVYVVARADCEFSQAAKSDRYQMLVFLQKSNEASDNVHCCSCYTNYKGLNCVIEANGSHCHQEAVNRNHTGLVKHLVSPLTPSDRLCGKSELTYWFVKITKVYVN